jgi:hypothetical protein
MNRKSRSCGIRDAAAQGKARLNGESVPLNKPGPPAADETRLSGVTTTCSLTNEEAMSIWSSPFPFDGEESCPTVVTAENIISFAVLFDGRNVLGRAFEEMVE